MELYDWQKEIADKAVEILERDRKCCVVQATGTGKTFITVQLLNTVFKDLSVLYVVPTNSITDSIQMYDDWNYTNIKYTTYAGLSGDEDCDVLIIDEMHRAGAPTYYPKVVRLMQTVTYTLGLTATQYRYLEKRRDMAADLFGDSVVWGPGIVDAVNKGILPKFDYISILSNVAVNILKKSHKYSSIRYLNDYSMVERIQKYATPEHKKIMVFFRSVEDLKSSVDDMKDWFGWDTEVFAIHSENTKKQNTAQLEEFNTCTGRAVMCAVNMGTEGIHIKGVTLVVLARRTSSGNVFIQQIGRALSASNKEIRPVILDIVENYRNLKVLQGKFKGTTTSTTRGVRELIYIAYDDVMINIEKVLRELECGWTEAEDDILRKYYSSEGRRVWVRFEKHDAEDCLKRARKLGLKRGARWTPEEDVYIKTHSIDECTTHLEGRNRKSIYDRAVKLGIIKPWTQEEDLTLMKMYDPDNILTLALIKDRTLLDTIERAKVLHLIH